MDIIDTTLADFEENDLKELWDSDYYAEALKVAGDVDWTGVLEGGGGGGGGLGSTGVVLNDRLMTEASLGVISQLSTLGSIYGGGFSSLLPPDPLAPDPVDAGGSSSPGPVVKVEHSYSLASDPSHPHSPMSDLESECFPAIPISEAEGGCISSSTNKLTTTATTTTPTLITTTLITNRRTSQASTNATTTTTTTTTTSRAPINITTATTTTSSGSLRKHNTRSCSIDSASSTESQNASITAHSSSASSISSSQPKSEVEYEEAYEVLGAHHSIPTSALLAMPSLKTSMGLVRPSAVVVTQRSGNGVIHTSTSKLTLPSLTLRVPSVSSTTTFSSTSPISSTHSDPGFILPPTPPSSSSSDSECGSLSPTRSPPLYEALNQQFCSPRKTTNRVSVFSRNPINTPLISTQPKGATGAINLTEEEKRTLVSEGYSIPSRLPLTKAEEKSLKKIRRKIKNKISAQESRRKKKDYMDTLERKVEKLSSENMECKRRIELLQTSNSQLLLELQQLQSLVEQDEKYRLRSSPMATLLS